jgi:hypothetical protein
MYMKADRITKMWTNLLEQNVWHDFESIKMFVLHTAFTNKIYLAKKGCKN